jgi:hypothetical protein
VAPGFIESDMTADLDTEPILRAIPLGPMGSAAEVAGVVRFLAADPAAASITGTVWQLDGAARFQLCSRVGEPRLSRSLRMRCSSRRRRLRAVIVRNNRIGT